MLLTCLLSCLLTQSLDQSLDAPKAAWIQFLQESEVAAPGEKRTFDQILVDAVALGLPHADEPKSALVAWARSRFEHRPLIGGDLPLRAGVDVSLSGLIADVEEREPNNTRGWTDSLELGQAGRGDIGGETDSDLWSFEVSEDSLVDLITGPGTDNPLPDSTLELSDEFGGFLAFSDDDFGLYAALSVPLSPGRYYARVKGFASESGTYVLSTSAAPLSFVALNPNGTANLSATLATPVVPLRLELPASGQIEIQLNGIGGFDPVLDLRAENGTLIASNDDGVGLNSRLRLGLSAGTYLLYASGFGGAAGSFAAVSSFTPGPLASACGGATTASYTAAFALATIEVVLPGPGLTDFRLTLSPSGFGGASDTVMSLYDANWRFLTFNDDSQGLFSSIRLRLPPGTYRALVRPFGGSALGSFGVSADCSTAATASDLNCGATQTVTLPASGSQAFRLTPLSSSPVELTLDNLGFANDLDSVAMLFDLSGHLLDWNDDVDSAFNAQVGARLPNEGGYGVVTSFGGVSGGSAQAFAGCSLDLFGTPALGATLLQLALAKHDSFVITLLGAPTNGLTLPVVEGLLLVDLNMVTVPTMFFSPLSGSTLANLDLPSNAGLAGMLLRAQQVVLDPDRSMAWLSNPKDIQL